MGHTGTLDPLASGILVVCVGAATRLAEFVQQMDKVYRTRLLFGVRSDTDDVDGTLSPVPSVPIPDRAAVDACLQSLIGEISQVPPNFSAPAQTLRPTAPTISPARGKKPRDRSCALVYIYAINLCYYEYPHLDLEVRCGKGTYIRSLARSIGDHLGCGAVMEEFEENPCRPVRAGRCPFS